MPNLGELIKALRKERGMTQVELAKQAGYTGKSMISRIENGKNKPSYEALSKIARALDMSPGSLLEGETPQKPRHKARARKVRKENHYAKRKRAIS